MPWAPLRVAAIGLHLLALATLHGGESFGRVHLCVFIPVTTRTPKDAALARAALRTWASEPTQRAAGALVRFASVQNASGNMGLGPHEFHVPGDVDTDYRHLPIRVWKLWEHLGQDRADECEWYMKADPDTYVNLRAVGDRLSCFDSAAQHFFGVVHASVPPAAWREDFPSLFFAHGGSGYIVSRGLLSLVGAISAPCLQWTLWATRGDAMEDVVFACCLRNRGVEVMNYGFIAQGGVHFGSETMQEFIVNFHQVRDALFDSASTGTPLQRSPYWDAQPPPLHDCLLMAHPVEAAEDLGLVHMAVSSGMHGGRPARQCLPSPMSLARQLEVRMAAPGGTVKRFWSADQVKDLDRCLLRVQGAPPRCEWRNMTAQCYGLSFYVAAESALECASACCRSGNDCGTFQFRDVDGCWIGESTDCQVVVSGHEAEGWIGGVKIPTE